MSIILLYFIISTPWILYVFLQTFWEDKNTFSVSFLESYKVAMCIVLNLKSGGMELFASTGNGILKPFFSSITFCSLQWVPRRLCFTLLNYHLREIYWGQYSSYGISASRFQEFTKFTVWSWGWILPLDKCMQFSLNSMGILCGWLRVENSLYKGLACLSIIHWLQTEAVIRLQNDLLFKQNSKPLTLSWERRWFIFNINWKRHWKGKMKLFPVPCPLLETFFLKRFRRWGRAPCTAAGWEQPGLAKASTHAPAAA